MKWEEKSSEEQVSTHLNKRSSVPNVVKFFGSITFFSELSRFNNHWIDAWIIL